VSKREVTECDRCGKTISKPVEIYVTTGWSSDPAGGRSTQDQEALDLCPPCAAWAFERVAKKLTEDEGAKLVEDIKRARKS